MATMVGEFELYNSNLATDEKQLAKVIFWKRPNTDVEVTFVQTGEMGWNQRVVVMKLGEARKFYRQLQAHGFLTYEKFMEPK